MPSRQRTEVRRKRSPIGPWIDGVNELIQPHALKPTELSDAENIDLDTAPGKVLKRYGSSLTKANIPILANPPRNAYEFVKSDGTVQLVLTDDEKVVVTEDFETFTEIYPGTIPGAADLNPAFFLEFETAQDKVWMTNGNDFVMSWDGIDLVVYDQGTADITWNFAGGDTANSLSDALLDRGGVGTWKGHTLVCTDATNAENIGIAREVLTFDDGTDTVTFDAFPLSITDGDKFKVGVRIPRGRYIRYHFDTLFVASTPENSSEVRFNDDTDPNEPDIIINIGNPNAWPATNQLSIAQNDGDRIWGLTPVYRDRFFVHKATGLYRIDPHPTFLYTPYMVSREVGSRYTRSFVERDGLLYFLGQRTDGLPDVFTTDGVQVKDFERRHSRTLDNLKQPNQYLREDTISSNAQWNLGTHANTSESADGELQPKRIENTNLDDTFITAGTNIDRETTPGKVTILGLPDWDNQRDCSVQTGDVSIPANERYSKGFTTSPAGHNYQVVGSDGQLETTEVKRLVFDIPGDTTTLSTRNLNNDHGTILVRMKFQWTSYPSAVFDSGNNLRGYLNIQNGQRNLTVRWTKTKLFPGSGSITGLDFTSGLHEIVVMINNSNQVKVWFKQPSDPSPVQVISGTLITSSSIHQIGYGIEIRGFGTFSVPDNHILAVDAINFHEDFKGDSLDSKGGTISPTSMPTTLPASATVDYTLDYKRDLTLNASSNSFGKYVALGTLDGNTDFAFESASSPDNSTYTGFLAHANKQTPGVDNATPIDRYIKQRITLTYDAANNARGPKLEALYGGGLYLTRPILVGSNIAAWALFVLEANLSSGSIRSLKIRRSTNPSTSTPDAVGDTGWDTALTGSDASGFVDIAADQNIGTVLGDGTPPTSRWVQFMYQLDVADDGGEPKIDFHIANWIEGEVEVLPVNAVIYKKKYLLTGADRDSSNNDIIVCLDSANAFYNWKDLNINHLFFFKGRLYGIRSTAKDIIRIEPGLYSDEGTPISAFIESRQEILGDIGGYKKLRYLDLEGDSSASTNTYSYKKERDSAFQSLNTADFSSSEPHRRLNFPMGVQARRVILRVENANLDEDMGLQGLILGWEFQPSRSGGA